MVIITPAIMAAASTLAAPDIFSHAGIDPMYRAYEHRDDNYRDEHDQQEFDIIMREVYTAWREYEWRRGLADGRLRLYGRADLWSCTYVAVAYPHTIAALEYWVLARAHIILVNSGITHYILDKRLGYL